MLGLPRSPEVAGPFRTDLDLLAPLGNGTANAGLFFKDFAKPGGSRLADATAAHGPARRRPAGAGQGLPPDDPLLLAAEPWCDQATMSYYPDFFRLEGYDTQLPNLLVPLAMAKSWVARSREASDPLRAMADCRRAIRLGRLLRQEGTTVIADLVGLACIRAGAQGLYDLARQKGDVPLALVAATVLGEHAPQRLLTSERVTKVDLRPFVRESAGGDLTLALPDSRLEALVEMATTDPETRFRGEAIITLGFVRALGTAPQQEKALAALSTLAASKDAEIAAVAAWSRDNRATKESLAKALAPIPK